MQRERGQGGAGECGWRAQGPLLGPRHSLQLQVSVAARARAGAAAECGVADAGAWARLRCIASRCGTAEGHRDRAARWQKAAGGEAGVGAGSRAAPQLAWQGEDCSEEEGRGGGRWRQGKGYMAARGCVRAGST